MVSRDRPCRKKHLYISYLYRSLIFAYWLCSEMGRVTLVEQLPDDLTSWVISAFAVRNDTALALTADPFEVGPPSAWGWGGL